MLKIIRLNLTTLFENARVRLEYLKTWVAANPNPSGSPLILDVTSRQTIVVVVLISVSGISILVGYYFIRKKPKEEKN